MSRAQRYFCGTPEANCSGAFGDFGKNWRGPRKLHESREAAFRCYARYLVKIKGWKQVGPREFKEPGGPINVLTKKSRFGGVARKGKMGRNMPQRGGGVIISK